MSVLSSNIISVFAVGKYRQTANDIVSLFDGSSFRLCGMLDTASPEPYKFSPDRLRLVLRAVSPPPRCMIVGEAISIEENSAAVEVWKEFVEEMKSEIPLLINLRQDPDGRTVNEVAQIPKDELIKDLIKNRIHKHFYR